MFYKKSVVDLESTTETKILGNTNYYGNIISN